jgi:hypothetical protein
MCRYEVVRVEGELSVLEKEFLAQFHNPKLSSRGEQDSSRHSKHLVIHTLNYVWVCGWCGGVAEDLARG